jgi:hypothetical protein
MKGKVLTYSGICVAYGGVMPELPFPVRGNV